MLIIDKVTEGRMGHDLIASMYIVTICITTGY